jgi:hypothetical protein
MSKSLKLYIALLIVLLVAIIYFDVTKPKPINWNPTYEINDKIPLGLYVFDKEVESIFRENKIEKINITPYEFFYYKYNEDTLIRNYNIKGTFLSISEYSDIDDQSIAEICNFVSHGNSAFISSKIMPNSLLDSLKLKMNSEIKIKDTVLNWIANKNLGNMKFKFSANVNDNYFSKIDTLNTTVLGYQQGDSTRINFIKVPWINGNFYLHTQPAAFTNYYLLKDKHSDYAQKVLSYIPEGTIFWHLKNQTGAMISNSPLRFIFSNPALSWAWYIAIIGMIFFMIFNARRKQRVVPIIEPLRNSTIDFTKTIGNLYYQEGNHDDIINKKIIYFLEKIRNEYLIDTSNLNDDFVKKFQLKSGKNKSDIQKIVFLINNYLKSPHTSIEEDLVQINKAIEKLSFQ